MKKLLFRIMWICLMVTCSSIGFSQSIIFSYDDAGNRLTRSILIVHKITNNNIIGKEPNNIICENEPVTIDYLGITVNPNPNSGKFEVLIDNLQKQSSVCIYLHTIKGILIYEEDKASTTNTIDITNRENGIYILTIIANGSRETWKVIKQ